jgi:serine/threonine protein kinase
MTPDRWEQINKLYYAALEVAEQERGLFLEAACAADAELRSEVQSLLNMHEQVDGFLGKPAMEEMAKEMKDDSPSLVGRRLGPYQVLSALGAGGMGEVYKARDTRLNRTVAIKVLPKHLSERPDLRQRMEREARAIGSLSHPHICPLFDIGTQDGMDFLVMEYLEGETLSQRLKRGPLPTEEVLRYAMEIVGGLDQAHRKGVIHRDLKPGNIMLTESGAKLLDFGLAKQTGGAGAPRTLLDARGSARPTQSLTEEGMLLGTLEYMAPEQLEGKVADARTDIFALGVVIYEMATAKKAFEGDSKASVMAKILTAQPPLMTTIEPVTPPELDRVVQKCLAKKPEERWQSAADLTSQLQEIAESNLEIVKAQKRGKEPSGEAKEIESKAEPAAPVAIPEPRNVLARLIRSRRWRLSFVGVLLALVIGSLVVRQLWHQPEKPSEKPKEMSLKPLTSYGWDDPLDSAAISPDGKYLAFCSKGKLFVQVIRSGEKRSLSIPEWFQPAEVSWFPDGTKLLLCRPGDRWIQVKGETSRLYEWSLWSVSILGGTPQKIVDHALFPSVSPDGSLVAFSRYDPERQSGLERRIVDLWLVGANGGGPRLVRAAPEGQAYIVPRWSTNGQRLFYIRIDAKDRALESCDIRGEKVTTIFSSKGIQWSFCWAPDGRILFSLMEVGPRSSIWNLWEIKVDAATGKPISEARPFTQWSGYNFSFAKNLSITADGKQLALLRGNSQSDVYVAEAEAGGKTMKNPRRLTLEETDDAIWDWTADSRAVLFVSYRNGNGDIFKQDISQTEAEAIVSSPEDESHPNFSPDRTFILYLVSEKRRADATRLMRIPVSGGPPELVLTGEKIKNFSCAREVNLCAVVEEVDGKQILTAFDPVKGRGEKLSLSDFSDYGRGILSAQGQLIEKMKPGPAGLHIRVRSLTGGTVKEITYKNLTGEYGFSGWSLDGKGVYLSQMALSDSLLLYASLDGRSQVLWKRGLSPGHSAYGPVASPDGRHLAFTVITAEENAWLLENF